MTGFHPLSAKNLSAASFTRAREKLSGNERRVFATECAKLLGTQTSPVEQPRLVELLELIAEDVDVRVREALSHALAANPHIPRALARRLADDVDLVAVPVLEMAKVLTEEDILQILERSESRAKQFAIAGRAEVSERVTEALVARADRDAVLRLVQNPGAAFSENTLGQVVNQHGPDPRIQEGLVGRPVLPVNIAARLIEVASGALLQRLQQRHPVPAELIADILLETRERATVGLSGGLSESALEVMVDELKKSGRLTCSLAIRSLLLGNLDFFFHTLASLNLLDAGYVRRRVLASPEEGLPYVWPPDWDSDTLNGATKAIRLLLDMQQEAEKWQTDTYGRIAIQRLLTAIDVVKRTLSEAEISQLIAAATRTADGAEAVVDPWAEPSRVD